MRDPSAWWFVFALVRIAGHLLCYGRTGKWK